MPNASSYEDNEPIKLLFIGDTGSGKTGALASLAAAGYNLRILDFDNGLPILLGKNGYLRNPESLYVKQNPKCIENVHYLTMTEKMKSIGGNIYPQSATAWQKTMNLLTNWEEKNEKGETTVKLGPLSSWTTKEVLVIDSLSMLSDAAMNFHLQLNGALLQVRKGYEAQRDMGAAQNLIRQFLKLLYDSSIKCNIVMIAHIKFTDEITVRKQEGDDASSAQSFGTPQGYPNAIGKALSPQIGRYFNSMLIARTIGDRHRIYTSGQNLGGIIVNAKTSAPLSVKKEYPLETGLADYFKALKGE